MGYTHYWYHNRPFTRDEWTSIGTGFSNLMKALPDVSLANVDGTGKPVVTKDYIGFNGASPRACESFELFRTRDAWATHLGRSNNRPWRGFCKTNHQPYDLAVMALLLIVIEVAPGALSVESDEDMAGEDWSKARDVLPHMS